MDVTRILEVDHREVEGLFDKIEKAKGAKRQPMIDQLVKSLRAHMELEEKVVYPMMEPVTGHEDVEEANTEHQLARKILDDVEKLAPDDPGFGAALAACKGGISHHVKDEEEEVFPKLRKNGASVLKEMATPFMKTRMELGMPMVAAALAASSSKEELLDEARSASVEGAASMTKAQLADALSAKMS